MTEVLIGIPTLNGPDRLECCLNSISECTRFDNFDRVTVLVCDDGSTEEMLNLNKNVVHLASQKIKGLEMLVNGKREGVAASWNKLVRHRHADVVVLVNDDIEVVDHWLDVLVYSVIENDVVGMVGLNSHVGITKAKAAPSNRTDYCEARLLTGGGKLLASNGSIFAFRRNLYDEIGGFDERYFVFYEEVDFGVALSRKGFLHCIADYPLVYHAGGATTSDTKNIVAYKEMERSRQKFKEKWSASPDELRKQLARRNHILKEWNSQLVFLKD